MTNTLLTFTSANKIHQIPPQVLCFEITEIVAIANLAKVVAFIDEFKQLGCSFALDDFGTGMSSLVVLKNCLWII
jgi:EAL domain-containing protein (putative c-di-GMP-specific phosphodiesterase class I)